MQKHIMISRLIDGVSGIFQPIINLLSAAGLLKGMLAILTAADILVKESGTYLVLNAMADSLFYFLPMILAFTAAKKFGADPFTAAVIGGVLLYPSLTQAFDSQDGLLFAGIPVQAVNYPSSVLPILLAVGFLVWMERFSDRVLPELVRSFLKPALCIVLVGLATLFVFGPLGAVAGDALAAVYETLYRASPVAAGMLLGALMQPMVIFGFHWSFVLIAMNNISVLGSDTVLAFMGPPAFAQAGAALAVCLKSRDRNFRSICISAVLSACFGITEPAMFGVNLPRKKPMIAVCAGGAIGGALAGISGASAKAFAFPGLATLPLFLGDGFGLYIVSCMAGFLVAFLLAFGFQYDSGG
ncbi:protein-N(pi)-phosphohistidine--sugar phosphotransferase [Lawsonibacter asaccharolyticus]|nr:hypothetical protein LAWASA_3681 [Lawsonibacter asaccharolyticus]GBF71438.1 protein-N(pi)-phosphohistidine--sugar phosphotransferase [Lawsonibacter asaccharolyticus]